MKKRNRRTRHPVASALIFFCCFMIILPLLNIAIWAVTERWPWPSLLPEQYSLRGIQAIMSRSEELWQLCLSSVGLSLVVAVLAVVIGLMTARAFVFYDFLGKGLLYFLTVLPFLVPATVFAMGIHVMFIRAGLSDTVTGVVITHLIFSLPYAVHLLMDATRAVGKELEEQAIVLGAGPMEAFIRITLPLLSPVMFSALSMAYIVSFSQYFLTLFIGGGKVRTFAIVMVPYLQNGDRTIAGIYSVLFTGITVLVFALFSLISRKLAGNTGGAYYEG